MPPKGLFPVGPAAVCSFLAVLAVPVACGTPNREFDTAEGGSGGVAGETADATAGRGGTADKPGASGAPGSGAPGGGSSSGSPNDAAGAAGVTGAGGAADAVCESGETRCTSADVLQTCADDGSGFVEQEACTGLTPSCDASAGRCIGCESCDAATQVCKNNRCECAKSRAGADCSQPRFELVGSSIDYGYGVGASVDGAVIAGTTYDVNEAYSGFIWTQAGGAEKLTAAVASNESSLEPFAISKDGRVVVGTFDVSPVRAFRWTKQGKAVALGVLSGASSSYGYAVSADGSVVVGLSDGVPFRWTSAGMVAIPVGTGGPQGQATGVSDDGSVVVGSVLVGGKSSAYRWKVGDAVATPLGTFVGSTGTTARAVSGNGLVVVGDADFARAFRWSSGTGFVGIADSIAAGACVAKAANVDGSVVIGNSDKGAWVWNSTTGISMIETIVADLGFSTDGYDLRSLNAVSADGKTLVGGTSTPSGIDRAFVVRLP